MSSQFESFVNLELPRRPALLTTDITGFDGDPNDPSAPPIISLAPIGTYFLQVTPADELWRKNSLGLWVGVGAGGAVSAGVRALVYREGHTSNGPFVFNNFIDLYDHFLDLGLDSAKTIVYDDTLTSGNGMILPAHPTAGINYNMKSTAWEGISRPGNFGKTELRLDEGVSIINPPGEFRSLRVATISTTVSPFRCVGQESFFVRETSDLSAAGSVPLFDLNALAGFDFITVEVSGTSTLAGSSAHAYPVIDLLTDKIVIARVLHGTINNDCFAGSGNSILGLEFWQGGVYSDNNPLFTGTFLEQFVYIAPVFLFVPEVTSSGQLGVRSGITPVRAAAGPINIPLPPYSGVFKNAGYVQFIKETSGLNQVNVISPTGGSINGQSPYTHVIPPGGSAIIGGDGNGNYLILGDLSTT